MASITELLEALNIEAAAVSTADLASKLKASREGTLKQLNREKDKGYVDGNSQEGWLITESGRKALEKGGIHPSMIDEGVTPRQQFEAIGRRIGIKEDRIVLATDIVWSGDYDDIKWVWEALGQADIAADLRNVWVNAWRAKLHKGIPPELETELTGASKAEEKAEAKAGAGVKETGGRDYILDDDMPVRVGQGVGDFDLQTAKELATLRALKDRFSKGGTASTGAAPPVDQRLPELITALAAFREKPNDESVNTLLKELSDTKFGALKTEILSRIPQAQEQKSFIEQLSEFGAAMRDLGPILRSVLGIPESPQPTPATPLTDKNGNPYVMDIQSLLTVKRFEGDERRADAEQKAKEETGAAWRDFIGKVGSAVARGAGRE